MAIHFPKVRAPWTARKSMEGEVADEGEVTVPTSADEFRVFLAEIGETQSGFARTLKRIGDNREKGTILRHIQRMATGEARISGEMRVIMAIFRNSRRKRRAREMPKI